GESAPDHGPRGERMEAKIPRDAAIPLEYRRASAGAWKAAACRRLQKTSARHFRCDTAMSDVIASVCRGFGQGQDESFHSARPGSDHRCNDIFGHGSERAARLSLFCFIA